MQATLQAPIHSDKVITWDIRISRYYIVSKGGMWRIISNVAANAALLWKCQITIAKAFVTRAGSGAFANQQNLYAGGAIVRHVATPTELDHGRQVALWGHGR